MNMGVQTLAAAIVVAAASIDVMKGVAVVFSHTVAQSGDLFLTSATSDKFTFISNEDRSGGMGGDWLEATDLSGTSSTGIWLVSVYSNGGGTTNSVTGFAAS
jgi:hypothetical protein